MGLGDRVAVSFQTSANILLALSSLGTLCVAQDGLELMTIYLPNFQSYQTQDGLELKDPHKSRPL